VLIFAIAVAAVRFSLKVKMSTGGCLPNLAWLRNSRKSTEYERIRGAEDLVDKA
jgi:hypothetical protein